MFQKHRMSGADLVTIVNLLRIVPVTPLLGIRRQGKKGTESPDEETINLGGTAKEVKQPFHAAAEM